MKYPLLEIEIAKEEKLDKIGIYYNIIRTYGETDDAYRTRILEVRTWMHQIFTNIGYVVK